MDNLTQQQQNSENNLNNCDEMELIRASLILAFNRTGTDFDKNLANNIFFDVLEAHPTITLDEFLKALKFGSLGKYGKTYKLTIQEVCIWAKMYLDETRHKFIHE